MVTSVDLGHVGPARQQRLQHARRGRFADRDRAGDADDVGRLGVLAAEEALLRAVQPLRRRDVKRKQPRQRQIDLLDLRHVEPVVQRAQPRHLVRRQRHRRVVAQRRPFRPRIGAVRRKAVVDALFHHGSVSLRDAFSSRPDFLVRVSSSASTSAERDAARLQQHQQVIERVGGSPRSAARGPRRSRRSRSRSPLRRTSWRNGRCPCRAACAYRTRPRWPWRALSRAAQDRRG